MQLVYFVVSVIGSKFLGLRSRVILSALLHEKGVGQQKLFIGFHLINLNFLNKD